MMTNLFSVFDPASSIFISGNWISSFILILVLIPAYWITPTKTFLFIESITYKLYSEFKTLLGPTSLNGSVLPFIALFTFILLNNFLGLFPYIFTASSHMALTLTLSLPFWLAFMSYGWIIHTKHMFAHLVPQNTPAVLMPFMVLIETISNVIRPLTLAVRLMANMVAGHLLMTLLGNQTASVGGLLLISLLLTQTLLLALESAVSIIQAYVFAVLSTLYASEITSH